jgi:hypothetical protein
MQLVAAVTDRIARYFDVQLPVTDTHVSDLEGWRGRRGLSENGIRKEGERTDDKKSFDHAPFDIDGGGSVRQN